MLPSTQGQTPNNKPSYQTTNPPKKGNGKSFWYGTLSGLVCGVIYQPLEVLKINMIILPDDLFTNKIMRNKTYYG